MSAQPGTAARVLIAGPAGERWAHALRGTGADVTPATGATPSQLTDTFAGARFDAVVFTSVTPQLPAAIRTAALAGCDVLVAAPAALSAAEFASLAQTARRRGRIIRFHDGTDTDERLRFVRRMTRGHQAIWRPRYLRSLRADSSSALDDLALGELRMAMELLGAPERVSAVSPAEHEDSDLRRSAMMTLTFENGTVASLHVTAAEPEQRHEAVLACDGRAIVLDACNTRAPLQIHATARHGGPNPGAAWSEVISEFPAGPLADEIASAAELFVRAVQSRDGAATNCHQMAEAMRIWEAALRSIAAGGHPEELTPHEQDHERPALQVIVGGGRGGGSMAPPRLTVVRPQRFIREPEGTPA